MKTTSITIWYRRRVPGVRTTLRNVFGTGEGLLGYELLSGACLVQERGFWGTNYSPEHVWYRRGASGVRTTLRNMFGTGEGPLGYELHSGTCLTGEGLLGYELLSGTCLVQERGFWGTNYTPERVWYRRGASGVRTTLRNMCGTGEGPLMYGMLHKTPLVQENGF